MTIKRSKRYQQEVQSISKDKMYTSKEAIDIIKKTTKIKFDASVDAHFHLGINTKDATQIVRGSLVLPNGTGKTKKIVAFVTANEVEEATAAGADIIGDDEFIKTIKDTGKCDFDVAVATPSMMKKLGPIARTLGQKGLMPNPKTDTVTTNISKTIREIQKGKVSFRSDDAGNLHQCIGRVSFDAAKLEENFSVVLDTIKKSRPESMKGVYIQSISLCSSMGPSIRVAV